MGPPERAVPYSVSQNFSVEQLRDGNFLINALDGLGEHGGDGQILDLLAARAHLDGDRVEQRQLLDVAVGDALERRAGQDAVAGAGIDVLRAANLDDRLSCVAEGTGGIDHVVEEDAVLALDFADDVHDLALVGLLAALVDDSQTHVQLLGKRACAGHGADVGGDDNHLLGALAELLGIVVDEDGVAEQVVHRDIKEALNLRRVQIHRQDAVGAGGGQHVRDKLGGDGVAALGLAVPAGHSRSRE